MRPGARGQLYAILDQVADPTFRNSACHAITSITSPLYIHVVNNPTAMQVPDEFFPVYMAMSLHIWMLLVRLRTQGRDGRRQMQMLYEQFQEEVTGMVKKAGVKVR